MAERHPQPRYRVLRALESLRGGIHQPGRILRASQLHPESIVLLMERGVIMPYLSARQIRALPELA